MQTRNPKSSATRSPNTLQNTLTEILNTVRQSPDCFPRNVSMTRIALTTADGDHLEIELHGAPAAATEAPTLEVDPAHLEHCCGGVLELRTFKSIDDLDLDASAKAAAEKLLAEFPGDITFTSGRRSIQEQASAMAPNVVANRKWIEQTYKNSPQRAALQKWVDDHPDAKTAAAIATGLEAVMNSWTPDQKRNFSRHITGDAFDVQPVQGTKGEKIKQAIAKLPKLNWHAFSEGGLEIWHAQFNA